MTATDLQTLDWGGAAFDKIVFAKAVEMVPREQRKNISEFRFFVTQDVRMAYENYLDSRQTNGWTCLADGHPTECNCFKPKHEWTLKAYGVPVLVDEHLLSRLGKSAAILFAMADTSVSEHGITGPAAVVLNVGKKG